MQQQFYADKLHYAIPESNLPPTYQVKHNGEEYIIYVGLNMTYTYDNVVGAEQKVKDLQDMGYVGV